jgi:hypothetical protein
MPVGHSVRPQKWTNVIDLYDDGDYSAIWGYYDGDTRPCLGVRWNENYPRQADYPVWYVEPQFLTANILLRLLTEVNSKPSLGNINNLLLALQQC